MKHWIDSFLHNEFTRQERPLQLDIIMWLPPQSSSFSVKARPGFKTFPCNFSFRQQLSLCAHNFEEWGSWSVRELQVSHPCRKCRLSALKLLRRACLQLAPGILTAWLGLAAKHWRHHVLCQIISLPRSHPGLGSGTHWFLDVKVITECFKSIAT